MFINYGSCAIYFVDSSLVTFTISPTPADATVVLTASGYTQEGNSITVPSGTVVIYTVSKSGYITQTSPYTVTSTITLPITLNPEIPASTDWSYTVNGDDSATLTGYIGTSNYITVPDYVKGDL